jgi:hypothetical protein
MQFTKFAQPKKTAMISREEMIGAIIIAFLLAGALAYLFWKQRQQVKESQHEVAEMDASTKKLQLQAYERLILLADRIALPNLVNRLNQPSLSAKEMQGLLIQTIRQEFEYNITQQIYVSAEAWDAVRNLKEQNLMIINQVSSFLPDGATAYDLNKSLLELTAQNPKALLHQVVSEALSFEAKKLMK